MMIRTPVRPLLIGVGWDRPGGLNRYLKDLRAALDRIGVPSRTLLLAPATDVPRSVEVVAHEDDCVLRRLTAFARATRRCSGEHDIVDVHFALFAWWAVRFGSLRRHPVVVHFHGPWSGESAVGGPHSSVVLSVKRSLERSLYTRADRIVVLSDAFASLLISDYQVPPWKVRVVRPGVDLRRFTPDRANARLRLGLDAAQRVVVSARRLVPRVGVDVLLQAWVSVVRLDGQARLLIAGEGPMGDALQRQAQDLGLVGSVQFMGRVDDAALVDLYRCADVTVLPSLALEGFGLAAVEALACGTPVLVTDVGGLPEVVTGLDMSLVVPPADPGQLAQRLRSALDGDVPDAARCRAHAESFDWPTAALANLGIYQEAIDERRHAPRQIRVVYLDHCAQLSGAEIALARLLPAMSGVQPHVLLAEDGPLVGRLRDLDVSVQVRPLDEATRDLSRTQVGPAGLPLRAAVQMTRYVLALATELHRLQPDVVHANSLKAALYGSVAGRLAGVPVVWHARDRAEPDYLPPAAVRLVRAAAAILPQQVVANSQSTLDSLRLPPRKARRAVVVGDPYTAPLGQVRRPKSSSGLTVGMVGRLAPWKGQHIFLQAFAQARPHGPDRAVIVGSAMFGESDYEAELRRLVTELGLTGRVELLGFVSDVEAELHTFDVLVHASLSPEPFGQVLIEGMAAGLAVVASGAGGPAEIVTDGHNGLLHPPGDAASLARQLERLLSEEELRSGLGRAAQQRAADFLPGLVGPRFEAIYRDLLDRPARFPGPRGRGWHGG